MTRYIGIALFVAFGLGFWLAWTAQGMDLDRVEADLKRMQDKAVLERAFAAQRARVE